MRLTFASTMAVTVLALVGGGLFAKDYLTKEGRLADQLKVVQLQGGFAGFTGMQYTIGPDGSWTSESVFNEKKTPRGKGKLSAKDVAKLAATLEKYDLAGLPEKSGKEPGANPHILTLEFGKQKAALVGQLPPKLDAKNPAGTVDSRFAGIWGGVVGLLNPVPPTKEAGQAKPREEAIKQDRKRIAGTWRVVALEVNGNKAMEEDARKLTVVNGSDGTWTLFSEGKEISKGTSTFDPTKKPKAIDFTPTKGEGKGKQYLGIYELGERTRKLCFAPPGKDRPAEFSSTPGSEYVLVTFEREKP